MIARAIISTIFAIASSYCIGGEIDKSFDKFSNKDCNYSGEIKSGDSQKIISAVAAGCKNLRLDSTGGDVYEAMRMGRVIRRAEILVMVPDSAKCASACIYLFAAGVTRGAFGPILVHRPYLTELGASLDKTSDIFASVERESKNYFRSMNVREQLFDDMMKIPPEYSVPLSIDNQIYYGLGQQDPVYHEYLENKLAASHGLSKSQWLQKKISTISKCGRIDVLLSGSQLRTVPECWRSHFPEFMDRSKLTTKLRD